ncbi:hypothetical protein KM043_002599 [Ampulex compressa]|nr:hypothetical protein KM043_002599 [Ampulex compressa]
MQASSSSRNDNNAANKSKDDEDTTFDERQRLKTEIEQLKSLITRLEHNVKIPKFGDIKNITNPETDNILLSNKIPNVDIKIQNELYKYAGLYSSKCTKNEFVFKFRPSNRRDKDDTFAVQFFIQNGTATLGKWVMPMSVDMNNLASEIPIDKLKNVTPFLRACKHHIDCYWMRHKQFEALKSITSEIKNCTVHSNLGYTQVHLELFRVQDVETNTYMNLIIYISYNTLEARPHKISIDLNDKGKLSNAMTKQLKSHFKCFRSLELKAAFDEISNSDDTKFVWIKESGQSPIELEFDSSSEEGMLTSLIQTKERSQNVKKRKQSKKPIESESESSDQTEISETSNRIKKDVVGKATTSQPLKKLNPVHVEVTPLNSPTVKLKRIKLNFHLEKSTKSPTTESLPIAVAKSSNPQMGKKFLNKILTSTPLHRNTRSQITNNSATNLDISDITVSDNMAKESNKITYSPRKNKMKDESQSKKNTSERTLRSKAIGAATKNNISYYVSRSMKQG